MSTPSTAAIDLSAAETSAPPARGWFAHMIQVWLEHHARVFEMGVEPL
ncbi:hypothetical protein [Methylobacterium sp. J-068]|nr:hypothetical protein [Methylobacterium sp. J-068]MCJ2036314.1 hypothetical protein [Methylobacterium sp. J-068]